MRANPPVIRALRERSGLSSAFVARESKIDPTHYWRIEAGERKGTAAQLVAIAAVLKVPVIAITVDDAPERVAS